MAIWAVGVGLEIEKRIGARSYEKWTELAAQF
jgi:hypothetical protein